MAPAQALVGIDEERKPDIVVKSEAGEANGEKVMMSDATGLVCMNNFQDNGFYAESSCNLRKVDDSMDQEVEILDCDDGVAIEKVKAEDPDATDYSSSFGATFSGSDNESKLSDVEVDSRFGVTNGDPAVFDEFNRVFKKKKVTAHWRKFISPLTWRCQWLELQMKELRSQSLKYDKELAAYEHEKELQSKMVELDGSVSRSVPLTGRSPRKQIMKRRKRKRNEDIADISSYMSNHHIFSYYENKKTETDGHSVDDDCGEQADENVRGTEDSEWLLGIKGRDSSLEQILLNIEAVQSRVLKLKTHLNKIMCRNAAEISSYPGNLFPGDPPSSYAQSHSGSPRNNDGLPIGAIGTPPHHVSEYEMEDTVMPGSAVSSYGDAADVDIIESTMGLLSAADGPLNQHQIRDLCKDSADDVLINNQAAEEKFQNFEKVGQPREKPEESVKEADPPSEEESIAPKVSKPGPGPETENVVKPQQTVLKPCYPGKRRGRKPKRKRRASSVAALNLLRSERLQKRRISARKS